MLAIQWLCVCVCTSVEAIAVLYFVCLLVSDLKMLLTRYELGVFG